MALSKSLPVSGLRSTAIWAIVLRWGEGVLGMRLHFGPGRRLYFWQEGSQVYRLLARGNKGS